MITSVFLTIYPTNAISSSQHVITCLLATNSFSLSSGSLKACALNLTTLPSYAFGLSLQSINHTPKSLSLTSITSASMSYGTVSFVPEIIFPETSSKIISILGLRAFILLLNDPSSISSVHLLNTTDSAALTDSAMIDFMFFHWFWNVSAFMIVIDW